MRTSIVIEEYLQAIYELVQGEGKTKAVHLTSRLGNSPSTVHSTLARMLRDGLIEIDEKKCISFTEKGNRQAEGLARRHRLVETFLCDHLGIPWHEVHQHTHILEHGLTPLVEEKLYQYLGNPKFCPHGNPFPGESGSLPPNMIRLNQVKEGEEFEVVMVDESLEDDKELMKYLWDYDIRPQKKHLLVRTNPITQSLLISGEKGEAHLPLTIAPQIGVILL